MAAGSQAILAALDLVAECDLAPRPDPVSQERVLPRHGQVFNIAPASLPGRSPIPACRPQSHPIARLIVRPMKQKTDAGITAE